MSRRANGESSIFFSEADGKWHGFVAMGTKDNGRPDRRHRQGKSRKDVLAKVRLLEQQRASGNIGAPGRAPTFGEWVTHWLDNVASAKCRARTIDGYRSYTQRHLIPGLGAHRIDRLEPEHVERFYVALNRQGLAAASVLQIHRIASRAMKIAQRRGRVGRNVFTLVDAPTATRTEAEFFTASDAKSILAAAEGQRNAARWSVALAMGLRQGEALGLCWEQVDLAAGTLRVSQQLQRLKYRHGCDQSPCGQKRAADCPQRAGRGLTLVELKTAASKRTLALPGALTGALEYHQGQQSAERAHARELWSEYSPGQSLVFSTHTGGPIDPKLDGEAWRELLGTAGVPHARGHTTRHTAASLLLLQGVSPRTAQQILGHASVTMTVGTYSHVAPELFTDAADAVGGALW